MVIRFRPLVGAPLVAVVVVLAAVGVVAGRRAEAAVAQVALVSSSAAGLGGDGGSMAPSVSGDGTLVAFNSEATNLDPLDSDPLMDVYVKNVVTGAVEVVSVDVSGVPAGGAGPAISSDGRYVSFTSLSANLVTGDTNRNYDVFVRDLWTDTTLLASINNSGDQADGASFSPSISGDGRYVAFVSNGRNMPNAWFRNPGQQHVYVRDMVAGTTVRVSTDATNPAFGGNGWSFAPDISDDGRFVAYGSAATNLVTTPDTNGRDDVFWWDRLGLSPPVRVSVGGRNTEGDGRSGQPSISADGRYIAFWSMASNLGGAGVQVYVRDVTTRSTQLVSRSSQGFLANGQSDAPTISGDGRYIAFQSSATNLVGNDTKGHVDVFLRDRVAGTTVRVSLTGTGAEGNESSHHPAVSAGGTQVAFSSRASDLAANDTNGHGFDVFIASARGPDPPPTPTGGSPTLVPSPG
jgi:Tol biopolymer transport system component